MKIQKKIRNKKIIMETGIFFLIILFLSIFCFGFFNKSQEKEGKLNATYTAEASIRNVEMQLSQYLENSDLLKSIISSEGSITDDHFMSLAKLMKQNKDVIEAYELAPGGIVEQVYPIEGNEEAMGMDMLNLTERKTEALRAKKSGEYTIAGPYELKQGGISMLIFDPIYLKDGNNKKFWGFSLLVLNWDRFLKKLQIEKLKTENYQFEVWKKDVNGKKIVIMNDGYGDVKNALTVPCSVPNDTWYFDIYPRGGWILPELKILEYIVSVILAIFLAVGFWQIEMRKIREEIYSKALKKSAKKANAANEAKTRFLFNMSHDIRTPMNAIIGYSELLEKNLDNKDIALSYLKKIRASNTLLLSLINYILEMARIESGKMVLKEETGNLKKFVEILKAVSEPQIEEKHLNFSCNFNIQHENIICDTTKVREIILNILSNAIKYTPNGGKVSLTIEELNSGEEGYANYCFTVEDNGIGMHEEYLPHIFEEFSRERTSTESKVVGAGLGLPIVKSLVDMMNGKIEVESKLNEGTKFTIYLSFPIADEEADYVSLEQPESEDNDKKELTGKRVLLVEDNELNAEIAMEILKMRGLSIEWAENGQKCIELLEKMPESYYDAILMDIQMPVMDGYETTKKIRMMSDNKKASIPIIAMTANVFSEDRQKAFESGMNDHVAKPIDVKELISTLLKYI